MAEETDRSDAGARARAGRVRWLIDGMNLIGSRADRWWNDPDRAVRKLVDELDRYAATTHQDVTVVFDRRPPDFGPGNHGLATVAFASRRGRDAADHEIVRMVEQDTSPHALRVVTSDRRLIERVGALGAAVTSSSAFRRRLDEALQRPSSTRPRTGSGSGHRSTARRRPTDASGTEEGGGRSGTPTRGRGRPAPPPSSGPSVA